MAQNIYDDEIFFAGYAQLPRSVQGLDGAPEWPELRAVLPALKGKRVLDLGCGYGWFCRYAAEQGAAHVLGVDVSERMLARAEAATSDLAISYLRADLETFVPDAGAFDLVHSSLAFHYLEKLDALFARVHAALVPGGRLVFSAEHPIYTAPVQPGFVAFNGRRSWPVNSYLDEGPRTRDWLAEGVIKHHRTIGTYVELLLRAGFTISHLNEWAPSRAQVAAHPEWAEERDRPMFMIMACERM